MIKKNIPQTKKNMPQTPPIIWLPLEGDQECSPRLGFNEKRRRDWKAVSCQEVYDIAWETVKRLSQCWAYINRPPHILELQAAWNEKTLSKPFLNIWGSRDIVREAKTKIIRFYKKHLYRKPTSDEISAAFRQCFINPKFKYDYTLENARLKNGAYSRKAMIRNYERRKRSEKLELCDQVEISKCVLCGKPVYAYDEHCLVRSGEIEMSFGYGSHRDTSVGRGHIHDLCSAKLDQVVFKARLTWNDEQSEIDIKKSERSKNTLIYKPRETGKDDHAPRLRYKTF
jgi:hypothetical protein